MQELKTITIFKDIHDEIKNERTGTPEELGKKIGRKVSSVYSYIKILKSWGAPILYSRVLKTYVYTKPADLFVGYLFEE